MKIVKWLLSLAAAIILAQTLYFKFTAQPESVYIFETLGMEPYGRIGSGIAELLASILLLIPAYRFIGALLAFGTISGAIFFHLTSLGIEVQNDGGTLFYLAIVVFICSLLLLVLERDKLLSFLKKN